MALTKAEIEQYRDRLQEMRRQLTQILEGTTKDAQNVDEENAYSQHQADQGTDDFNRSVSLELSSQEFAVLRQVERALEKIDEGTYGECDLSGDLIPKKRLDAVPYATMTVAAQEKLEKGLL
ncbi:MAG: TraR/DksA family transcriptional regulator [Chlamydiia bacterium]|nr:TraR/DksA family transcriptional regulator [Chlamydiia bacterium]